MRIQLESPKSSGRTNFRAADDGDVLMEDVMVAAAPEDGDAAMDEGSYDEVDANIPEQSLSELGIKTSEQLIKRLKSKDQIDSLAKDKIYVARLAFKDDQVPIPKKIFLLTDWLLDSIIKIARDLPSYKELSANIDAEAYSAIFVHDDYWKLLKECVVDLKAADMVLLANKYPLPPLLESYIYFWNKTSEKEIERHHLRGGNGASILPFFCAMKAARTSKQIYHLDSLNRCLASWLQDSAVFNEEMIHRLKMGEEVVFDHFIINIGFLDLCLSLWLVEAGKPTNAKKMHDVFLAEMLPLHSEALWCMQNVSGMSSLSTWTPLFDRVRAITYRISYQSLVVYNQPQYTQQAVLKSVAEYKSKAAGILLSTYLSQLCLYRKDTQSGKNNKSWVKDGEWRQEIFQSFYGPAVELLLPSLEGEVPSVLSEEGEYTMASLHLLLSTANKWNLHFVDDNQAWRKFLERVTDYILKQHTEIVLPHVKIPSTIKTDTFHLLCSKILVTVLELDESILEGERCTKAIQCSLHQSDRKTTKLLKNLCSTSIRSRKVVAFVESCQDALDNLAQADIAMNDDDEVKADDDASDKDDGIISEKIIKMRLFQEEFWQQSLGVAVRDFVSVEDVVQLLSSMRDRLLESCTRAYNDRRESHFAQAILQVYFASVLIGHLAIPRPAYTAAQECISSMQDSVVQKHLDESLSIRSEPMSDALATALLKLHDSVQECAITCANEEQEEGGIWNKLATQWDDRLGAYHSSLSHLITEKPSNRRDEIRIQFLLTVLNLIHRAIERRLTTPFDSLLSGTEGIALYTSDFFEKFHSPVNCEEAVDVNALVVPQLHGSTRVGIGCSAAWNLLVSSYLPIFERLACDKLLEDLANLLISLINFDHLMIEWLFNSSNLELPRWRDIVCAEMKQQKIVSMSKFFPQDWLHADLISEPKQVQIDVQEIEMVNTAEKRSLRLVAFGFCRNQSTGYGLVDYMKHATQAEYEEMLGIFLDLLKDYGEDPFNYAQQREEAGVLDILESKTVRALLQTIAVLLCNSPEGTLLVSQRCLSSVIVSLQRKVADEDARNRIKHHDEEESEDDESEDNGFDYSTSLASIQFIETVLSAKPILFRSADISAIFAMAAEILVAKCSPDALFPSKRKKLFTCICTTLIECIRLRRDYVAQYLPQLTMLLVKMIQVFQTATKIKKQIEEGKVVGIEEAKLLNRLLSTVTAKSTSTSVGGLPESKMKSLAKSFSTHAPYVIVALVRNMTAATFARGEMREELTRGIYELCDIVGPWQKNVMMDMLADEGERIVMRSLWRGWEAQRYKGT